MILEETSRYTIQNLDEELVGEHFPSHFIIRCWDFVKFFALFDYGKEDVHEELE